MSRPSDDNRSQSNATRRDTRRKERSSTLAKVCRVCHSVAASRDARCRECGMHPERAAWQPLDELPDPWLGRCIDGRWEIRQPLGDGTTGRVYRARDRQAAGTDGADERVAMKIVQLDRFEFEEDRQADTLRRRARMEASVMSGVRSPHIARVDDFVEPDDATFALVMEFVTGPTLTEWVDEYETPPWGRALRLGASLASAVAEIHDANILHCDVKPENVIVSASGDGDGDLLKLVDFGLAERLHTPDERAGRQVDSMGTPLFASPEQVRMEPIRRASDVYAIGATIFFALTGRPPVVEPTLADLHAAHRYRTAPRLSHIARDRRVPTALDDLLARMMERQPDQRPEDLHGVSRRLQQIANILGDDTARPGNDTAGASSLAEHSSSLLADPDTDAEARRSPEPSAGASPGRTPHTGANYAISRDDHRTLTVLTVQTGDAKFTWGDPFGNEWTELPVPGVACAVDACAEAGTAAIGQKDGTISVYQVSETKAECVIRLRVDDRPRKLRYAPDGYLLAVETRQECKVLCTSSGEVVHDGPPGSASDLGF